MEAPTASARLFETVARGARVAVMVGGRSDVRAVGTVQDVTGARFTVQFPAVPEAAIAAPFSITFRKSDGRSLGRGWRLFALPEPASAAGAE